MGKTISIGFSIILVTLNAQNVLNTQCNGNGSTIINTTKLNSEPSRNLSSWNSEQIRNGTNLLNRQQVGNLTDICRQINLVDDTIGQILHAVPRYGGNALLDNIRSYVRYLNCVMDYLKLDKETTKRVAEDFLRKGSAKYLAVDTVDEMLRRRFQWTTRDLEIYENLRYDTIETWYTIITVAFKDED